MKNKIARALCVVLLAATLSVFAAGPKIFFVSPKNGETVTSPLKVKFGIEGMRLRPAGEDLKDKTSGHHHLLIDTGAIALGMVIPKDDKNLHFGKGQTETEITLTPGKHKLTLQFADGGHLSYGPAQSETIEVTVK